jgi:hypothetical protein
LSSEARRSAVYQHNPSGIADHFLHRPKWGIWIDCRQPGELLAQGSVHARQDYGADAWS